MKPDPQEWLQRTTVLHTVPVALIKKQLLIPVHVDILRWESDPHVAVAPLADNLHLEVVEAAGGGDGVRGSYTARVLDWLLLVLLDIYFTSRERSRIYSTRYFPNWSEHIPNLMAVFFNKVKFFHYNKLTTNAVRVDMVPYRYN